LRTRERTLVVPVSAHWKSPKGLLGQWNDHAGTFEPTLFANFMRAAELAWRAGDFATRIVIFENFDLSPTENWLAEILLRSQYPAQNTADRTLHLGGHKVRGWAPDAAGRLLISPAVQFIGVVDEPIQGQTLSPRLINDLGMVRIDISAIQALRLAAPGVTPKQTEALLELDAVVRPLHAGITLTTATAIRACLGKLESLEMDAWRAIDLVIEQEVMAKLELRDPTTVELDLGHSAIAWTEGSGKRLVNSAARLSDWAERVQHAQVFKGS
jgi:hypothetical protein